MGKSKMIKTPGETKLIKKPLFGVPSACSVSWPYIEKSLGRRIIEELKREIPGIINQRRSSKDEKKDAAKKDKKESDVQLQLDHKNSFGAFFFLGINAVTKALEKGPLLLVLACQSAKPLNMTHHLIPLCAMQETSGCCIAGLSNALSPVFGIQSVLAVGFKIIEENPFGDLVEFINDKIPPLDVPWINIWKRDCHVKKVKKGEAILKDRSVPNNFISAEDRDMATDDPKDNVSVGYDNGHRVSLVQGDNLHTSMEDIGQLTIEEDMRSDLNRTDQNFANFDCGNRSLEEDRILMTPNKDESKSGVHAPMTYSNVKKRKISKDPVDEKSQRKQKQRTIGDVVYNLSETQFNLRTATVKVKKQNKK